MNKWRYFYKIYIEIKDTNEREPLRKIYYNLYIPINSSLATPRVI